MASKQEFEYKLLGRLVSDAEAYHNCTGGKRLWGITPQVHAEEMVKLYKALKIKPQWITLKELKQHYYNLTKTELKGV